MAAPGSRRILTVNSGSSSLKLALYEMGSGAPTTLVCAGTIERIGLGSGSFSARDGGGRELHAERAAFPDHASALRRFLAWLDGRTGGRRCDAAGHRVVHGGRDYTQPLRVTPDVLAALKRLIPLAPAHLPNELEAMEILGAAYPDLPQVACFDTAFHRHMPRVAQMYGLPRDLLNAGVLRYGFHGLSYEYILGELAREAGPETANGRVVIAHLGNGSSMVAVRGGRGVETTMGFTPLGGLVMSTRPGDLDPGVLLYLLREQGMSPSALDRLLNRQSGLLGVSGLSSDMRDLLDQAAANPRAAEAIALYCYAAKKALGGLVAALGGLNTLVFTGGIGENAPEIRQRICERLEFLGIQIDPARNANGAPVISSSGGTVTVRVMRTNEDLMIARHTAAVLDAQEGAASEP